MAYITKLKTTGKWQAQIERAGVRASKTFLTKREAQLWALEQETKVKEGKGSKTITDLVDRYVRDVSSGKAGGKWERIRLESLREQIGPDTLLSDVKAPHIAAWRDLRLKTVSGSTVVREAGLLRNMFNVARLEWHWMQHNPFEGVRLPKENQPRQALWGWKDIKKVLRAPRTGKTAEVQRAFHLALRTGMRLQEVLAAPEHYNPSTRVVEIRTKTEAAARIPIGRIADRMLLSMPKFTVQPNEASVLFSKLCRELLITGLTFHDARATALTHLAKKVPVEVLAKISRHKNVSLLVNVYYRPKAADIARMI